MIGRPSLQSICGNGLDLVEAALEDDLSSPEPVTLPSTRGLIGLVSALTMRVEQSHVLDLVSDLGGRGDADRRRVLDHRDIGHAQAFAASCPTMLKPVRVHHRRGMPRLFGFCCRPHRGRCAGPSAAVAGDKRVGSPSP